MPPTTARTVNTLASETCRWNVRQTRLTSLQKKSEKALYAISSYLWFDIFICSHCEKQWWKQRTVTLYQIQLFCPHNVSDVIAVVISLEQRTPHACWRSPLTRPSEAKLTLCRLPTAKEILVITCSFLNIIEHRPFHQSKCVTFRFTAPLSVTDRSAEGLRWTIFVSSRLMGPKNRALCWPAGLSAHFRDRSTHPSPHTHPLWQSLDRTALFLDARERLVSLSLYGVT